MKKYLKIFGLIPLLLLAVACSGGSSDNFSGNGDGQETVTPPPPATDPTPPPDPTDPASPDTTPTAHMQVVETNVKAIYTQVSDEALLNTAFTQHAWAIYDGWSVASAENQAKVIDIVSKAWKDYLGYESLDSFKAALKADPQDTLNKFLQFEVHTILSASELYKAKNNKDTVVATLLNQMGDNNLAALQHLQGAFEGLPTSGNMPELEAFGGKLGSNNEFDPASGNLYQMSLSAAELRIFVVRISDCYGVKDYFTDVDASDSKFKDYLQSFMIAPDDPYQWTLPTFITNKLVDLDIYPYNDPSVCNYNPSCMTYKSNGIAIVIYMGEALPELLQRVSFTYTDDQGKKQYWSFFNFENVYVDGKMFTLARGRFGAHKTKDVIFMKESEFSKQ